MAHKNQLTQWLFDRRQYWNPNISQMSWPRQFYPGLCDFEIEVNSEVGPIKGRGLAMSEPLALEKSISELIERLICKRLNISTVGVAVNGQHSSEDHAYKEACERYFLGEHLKHKTPFQKLTSEDVDLIKGINQYSGPFWERIDGSNVKLSFYKMLAPLGFTGLVCRLEANDGALFLGFSYGDIEEVVSRAFNESLVNYAHYCHKGKAFLDESDENPDLWHLSESFTEKMRPLLDGATNDLRLPLKPQFTKKELKAASFKDLSDCPINPIRIVIEEGA